MIKLEDNYFCVSKQSQAQVIDSQQNVIKNCKSLMAMLILSPFKAEHNKMILAQSLLSFALSDFLTEYKDIYLPKLKTDKLKLLKSKAVALGMAYYVN